MPAGDRSRHGIQNPAAGSEQRRGHSHTHTRQGCYLEYAIECATEAANSGYYSKIRGDVAYLRIRKTAANYLSVTQAGDELDMSTWEDSDNPLLLNFAVSKEGQLINFMQIEYYESEST